MWSSQVSQDEIIQTIWLGPNPTAGVLIRDRRGQTEEKAIFRWRQKLEWCSHKPKNVWSHQKLKNTRKDSVLEPAEGAWYLDLRLLASKSMRESFFLVLSHQTCGHISWQHEDISAEKIVSVKALRQVFHLPVLEKTRKPVSDKLSEARSISDAVNIKGSLLTALHTAGQQSFMEEVAGVTSPCLTRALSPSEKAIPKWWWLSQVEVTFWLCFWEIKTTEILVNWARDIRQRGRSKMTWGLSN